MKRLICILATVSCFAHPVFADTMSYTYTSKITENGVERSEESYYINGIDSTVDITIGSDLIKMGSVVKSFSEPAYIQTGSSSAMLPLRAVASSIAAIKNGSAINVEWDSGRKSAHITFDNNTVAFTADSNVMVLNGKPYAMENNAKAEIRNNQLFVPLRALGQALNVNVAWNNANKTVTLSNKA